MKKENFRLVSLILGLVILVLTINTGCEKDPGEKKPASKYLQPFGVFVVNEGQFMAGNGDVSFYDKAAKAVSNDLFFSINKRPPGDIPQSLAFHGNEAWLIVNNSNTIEVIDLDSFRVKKTITGFEMPRQMKTKGNFGYVSQIGSGKIAIVDLVTQKINGYLEGEKSTDHLIISGDRLFAANWTSYFINKPNNTVSVFNLGTGALVDSVVVAKEPNSMVMDTDGMIWVLSSGGFTGEECPALTCFNPSTLQVLKKFEFPDKNTSPTLLSIAPDGKTIYFVNKDVFRMGIADSTLPQAEYIPANGRFIYGMAVDPENGELYISDACDFQSPGQVYRYNKSGIQIDMFEAGINPSGIFFYMK